LPPLLSVLEVPSNHTNSSYAPIPSFDSRPTGQEEGVGWEKDTLLRLEVTPLGKTDKFTIIFGPERDYEFGDQDGILRHDGSIVLTPEQGINIELIHILTRGASNFEGSNNSPFQKIN